MNKTLLTILLLFLLGGTYASPGGVDKSKPVIQHLLTTMEAQIHSPRGLYLVLNRIHQKHLDPEGTLACQELLARHPNNPYVKSSFSYCWFRATTPLSYDYIGYQKSPLLRGVLNLWPQAERCRTQAITEAPNSPEVLLQTAVAQANQVGTTNKHRADAVTSLRQAVRLDPKWSDAWYWLGSCLDLYAADAYAYQKKGDNVHAITQRIAKEEIAAYQRSEELDPKRHTDCLLGYAFAYGWLKDTDKQRANLEAYVKINPWFLKAPGIAEWRKRLAEASGKAADPSGA